LKNNSEVVNLVLSAKKNSQNLTRDYRVVMDEVAKEARVHVQKIRGENGAEPEVMTNKKTINVEGSEAPGVVVEKTAADQPTSFFDEMTDLQGSR
jgi:hypothetical protein